MDYASPKTRETGINFVKDEIEKINNPKVRNRLEEFLQRIQTTSDRDLYF